MEFSEDREGALCYSATLKAIQNNSKAKNSYQLELKVMRESLISKRLRGACYGLVKFMVHKSALFVSRQKKCAGWLF